MFREVILNNEKDWMAIRSKVLTATEVSVILGLNKYRTINEILADKKDPKPFENSYTVIGQLLEPVVVASTNKILGTNFKLFEQTKDIKSFFLDEELKLGSTPDASDGQKLLECKTTKPGNFLRYSGWPPVYYLAQLYTQLLCTSLEEGLLSILSTNLAPISQEIRIPISIFSVSRSSKIDSLVISEVERFWNTINANKVFRVNRKQTLETEIILRCLTKRIY